MPDRLPVIMNMIVNRYGQFFDDDWLELDRMARRFRQMWE